jgi:hypothetical protein
MSGCEKSFFSHIKVITRLAKFTAFINGGVERYTIYTTIHFSRSPYLADKAYF